jgi:uncharacterized membrane protein
MERINMSLEAAFGGLSAKTIIGLSGLAGGVTIAGFYIPKKIAEKGLIVIGAIVSAVSIFTSIAFTEVIISKFGLNPEEYTTMIAFVIGISSLFIINVISNYAAKHDNSTIDEVIDDIKDEIKEKGE